MIRSSIFVLNPKCRQKYFNYTQSPKSRPKNIDKSGNLLKSRFESEIRTKIFPKSADPFAYSSPSLR